MRVGPNILRASHVRLIARFWRNGGESRHAPERRETIACSWPVPAHGVGTGAADDRSEHRGRDDRVVRIPDHRDEVWHQIERYREVREEQPEPDAHAPRQIAIGSESSKQAQSVREDAYGLVQERSPGSHEDEAHDEHGPRERERQGNADDEGTHEP